MPQRTATIGSLPEAFGMLKEMRADGPDRGADCRAACGGAHGGGVGGVHDVVDVASGVLPVAPAEFVGDVSDPVGPAAPDRNVGMDGGQGGGEAVAAVRADHSDALAGGAAPVEGVGQALPFGGTFAAGGLEVDDPLAPVRKDPEGHRDGPPDGSGTGPASRHHAIGHDGLVAAGPRHPGSMSPSSQGRRRG